MSTPEEDFHYATELKRIQEIVDQLEANELPFDEAMAVFEEGQRRIERCQAYLREAELKISTLERGESGEAVEENYEG